MKHPYIQRYIYGVTKRLPASMREDVSAELSANIQDMMAEDPENEALLLEKLHMLGHPRVLANNYRGKDRYVVSPEYYDDYLSTLKIVGAIFIIVSLVSGILQAVTTTTDLIFPDIVTNVFSIVFEHLWEALLSTFAWTTIGFWIASTVNRKHQSDNWKLSDLPDLPENSTVTISRIGTVIELIIGVSFSLIFIILLRNGIPFFNQPVIDPFMPFFYLSVVLDLIVGSTKLFYGQWRWPVIMVVGVEHLYNIVFMYLFLNSNFLKADVFETIAKHSEFTISEVQNGFMTGKTVFIAIIVIGSIIDLIQASVKLIRAQNKA